MQLLLAFWGAAGLLVVASLIGAAASGAVVGPVEVRLGVSGSSPEGKQSVDSLIEWIERQSAVGPVTIGGPDSSSTPRCKPGSIVLTYESTVYRVISKPVFDPLMALGLVDCHFEYRRKDPGQHPGNTMLLSYVPGALILLVTCLVARRTNNWRAWLVHWQPSCSTCQAIGSGIRSGVLAAATTLVLGLALSMSAVAGQRFDPAPDVSSIWGLALLMVVFAPIVEEYVFRSWLQGRLAYAVGEPAAMLIATPLFIAAHFPASVYHAALLAIPGFSFAWLWMKSRSLTACVVAHAVFNFLAILAIVTSRILDPASSLTP